MRADASRPPSLFLHIFVSPLLSFLSASHDIRCLPRIITVNGSTAFNLHAEQTAFIIVLSSSGDYLSAHRADSH
jgi:hypothetical protein